MIRTGLVGSAICLGLMAAISIVGFVELPANAQIPVHWNLEGEVDRYAGRAEGLLLTPAIALGLAAVFAVVPRIDPRPENLRKSRTLYLVGWLGAMVLLTGVHLYTVAAAITGISLPTTVVIVAVGAFFALIGSVLAKSKPNFFAGVRTPWTLTSERAWEATHRWTGRLFVATGLLAIVAGLAFAPEAGLVVLLAGVIGSAIAGIVISYVVWRRDPDRSGTIAGR